jgi:DNA-directed RNA polymerase specialized sigma subunit
MYTTRQQEDLELWGEWKKTKSPVTLELLLNHLAPLINREVGKWGATVPRVALESKARVLTIQALEEYNPHRGAAIGTHVTNRLRKLSRFVYPYQNVARLPENKQLLFNTFQVAQNKLYDEHGRDPTVEEISDELGWTKKKVTDFQGAFGRRELVESEGVFIEDDSTTTGMVDFYYHGLAPDDKSLFEDITGYGGKRALSNSQLMSKYRLTQGQLSYRKRKFIDQIQRIQQGRI